MSTFSRLRSNGNQNLDLLLPNLFANMNREAATNPQNLNERAPNDNAAQPAETDQNRVTAPATRNPFNAELTLPQVLDLMTLRNTTTNNNNNSNQMEQVNIESNGTEGSEQQQQPSVPVTNPMNLPQAAGAVGRQSCVRNYNYTNFCCDICKEIFPFTIKLENDWEIESVKIDRPENTPYLILEKVSQAKESKVISVIKGNENQEVRMVQLILS